MSIFEAFMMITIVVGGGFALYKLGVFRDLKPHLTLEQSVTHRLIGDDYVHIAVQIGLTNRSKVAVAVTEAEFKLQQISPLSNEEVEILYKEHLENNYGTDMQWPILYEIVKNWSQSELVIEPNGRHYEMYDTIISNEIKTVLLSAYFANSKYKEGDHSSRGWEVASVCDVD